MGGPSTHCSVLGLEFKVHCYQSHEILQSNYFKTKYLCPLLFGCPDSNRKAFRVTDI